MVKKIRIVQWHTKTVQDAEIVCPYCNSTAVSYPIGSSAGVVTETLRYYCEACAKQFGQPEAMLKLYDSAGNAVGSGFIPASGWVTGSVFKSGSVNYH